MRHYKIAAILADGIGKEVIPAGIRVLHALAAAEGTFQFTFETSGRRLFDEGDRNPDQHRYHATA